MKQAYAATRPMRLPGLSLYAGDPIPENVRPKDLARMIRAGTVQQVLVFENPAEFEAWREEGARVGKKRLADARKSLRQMRARAFAPPTPEPEPVSEPEPTPEPQPEPENREFDLDL